MRPTFSSHAKERAEKRLQLYGRSLEHEFSKALPIPEKTLNFWKSWKKAKQNAAMNSIPGLQLGECSRISQVFVSKIRDELVLWLCIDSAIITVYTETHKAVGKILLDSVTK